MKTLKRLKKAGFCLDWVVSAVLRPLRNILVCRSRLLASCTLWSVGRWYSRGIRRLDNRSRCPVVNDGERPDVGCPQLKPGSLTAAWCAFCLFFQTDLDGSIGVGYGSNGMIEVRCI